MPEIIGLTEQDDELLFIMAAALASVADQLDRGEEVLGMATILRSASAVVAQVMASAYERRIIAEESSSLN